MQESDQQISGKPKGERERSGTASHSAPTGVERGHDASPETPREEGAAFAPSADELESILDRHRLWVESEGEEGECANLGGTDLREADLVGANLERADLTDANLQGALLKEANLKEAELWDAILDEAILVKANLEGAVATGAGFRQAQLLEANLNGCELHSADFSEAYLQNANLEDTRGLHAKDLRGADVTDATLPASIAAFDGLGRVEAATQYARKLFFIILAACVYSWLTIAMTTDAGLLTNTASSPLPIIGTTIPIVGFYWVAPLTLLVLYVYFHLQLQRLWEALAKLPAVFPDGQPLDQKADPWLLIGMVRAHLAQLKEKHLPFFKQQKGTILLVAWWMVPITLAFFTVRYLPKHDPAGAAFLLLLTATATWLAISYYRNAAAVLRGEMLTPFEWKYAWKDWRSLVVLFVVGTTLLPFAVEVGERFPAANLEEADLREADLRGVRMERARLFRADLRRSRLTYTQLRGADLSYARLDSADLRGADLQRADLQRADLQRADLRGADLQRADLRGAYLEGADLLGAIVEVDSLLTAQSLAGARVDSLMAKELSSLGISVEQGEEGMLQVAKDWRLPENGTSDEN